MCPLVQLSQRYGWLPHQQNLAGDSPRFQGLRIGTLCGTVSLASGSRWMKVLVPRVGDLLRDTVEFVAVCSQSRVVQLGVIIRHVGLHIRATQVIVPSEGEGRRDVFLDVFVPTPRREGLPSLMDCSH